MKKRGRKKTHTEFSQRLVALMGEKNFTVRKAGQIAKVGTSTIDSWRGGALPEDYIAVKRLAAGLEVSFSYLLTGEDDSRLEKPSINEVFRDGGSLFDGYAKITIQRLIPNKDEK